MSNSDFHVRGTSGNNPKGLLYHKHKKNRSLCIRLKRILNTRQKKRNTEEKITIDSPIFDAVRNCDHTIDDDFKSSWNEVYAERKKIFECTPIDQIFVKFPCLERPEGYELVKSQIFIYIFPNNYCKYK